MKIKEIELNNFRIYKGTNKIDLLPEDKKNMIIISGRNGYGKTTFLMSLVWCLYGKLMQKVDKLYDDEIKSRGNYQTYISNSINRLAKAEGENKFSVSITFIDVDLPIEIPTKEIKVIRSFDTFTKNEYLQILINGAESEITRKYGYEKFLTDFILPREIAKFFFFDAEKIVSLAEVTGASQKKDLSRAYSEVLGIKKYEDLKNQIQELLNKLKKESATTEERLKLNDLNNKIENHKILISEKNKKKDDLDEEISLLAFKIEQIQSKLLRYGHTITDAEYEQIKEQRAELDKKIKDLKNELKELYEYVPFGIAGNKMLEVSKQLALEHDYKQNKFKIENIENKTEKIINKLNYIREQKRREDKEFLVAVKIQEFYNETIRELIKKHLYDAPEELPAGFETILHFSENEKREFDTLISHLQLSFKEQLQRISKDYENSSYELTVIERRIKEAESNLQDEHVKELREKRKKLADQKDSGLKEIGSLEIEIRNLQDENTKLLKEKNKLYRHIEESDSQKSKTEKYKELITQLDNFIIDFQNKKRESLKAGILKNLKELLHMDLINDVKVEITSDYVDILLYNKRGEEINKDSLSKGQQQIYASSLLRSLVDESEISFPVFIDSPMQKFDETHSENIIRHFYPSVSEQVVIFPLLNKELTRKEFEILKPFVAKSFMIDNYSEDKSGFKEIGVDNLMK